VGEVAQGGVPLFLEINHWSQNHGISLIFTMRHYASAVYAMGVCLSVRPSVCHNQYCAKMGHHANNAAQ